MMMDDHQNELRESKPVIGYWVLPGGCPVSGYIKIDAYKLPKWHHRFFMSLLFGWKWENV